jgi:hypothetical protein
VGFPARLGYAYARAGRREEAQRLVAGFAPNPFNEALVYAGLGDKERTLEAIGRMAILGPAKWYEVSMSNCLSNQDPANGNATNCEHSVW